MSLPSTIEEILNLPNVPLLDRDQLPYSPGLYFVLSLDHEVLYVGRSNDINFRWTLHHKLPDLDEQRCRIHWMIVEDIQLLPGYEARMIKLYQPKLNYQVLGRKRSKRAISNRHAETKLDRESLQNDPRVIKWINDLEKQLPLIVKIFTYNRWDGCCSFCGETDDLKKVITIPSKDENKYGRDIFDRYLSCKACFPRFGKRGSKIDFDVKRKEVIESAVAKVEHGYSTLVRYGYNDPMVEEFLSNTSKICIQFHIENISEEK